jgi:imidazoleglycerol-phosphate dehydratase
MSKDVPGGRKAELSRESSETRVKVVLDLDGGAHRDIATGVGFFDHMLQQLAFHGQVDLEISAQGDLHIDDHHTVEDVGIVLGQAFAQAVKGRPIARYADAITPMDEALIMVALDFSGRGMLIYDVPFVRENLGGLATENIREFFRAFSTHAGITLHIRKMAGENDHHVAEGIFKGIGRALHQATRLSERKGVASTKGMFD